MTNFTLLGLGIRRSSLTSQDPVVKTEVIRIVSMCLLFSGMASAPIALCYLVSAWVGFLAFSRSEKLKMSASNYRLDL